MMQHPAAENGHGGGPSEPPQQLGARAGAPSTSWPRAYGSEGANGCGSVSKVASSGLEILAEITSHDETDEGMPRNGVKQEAGPSGHARGLPNAMHARASLNDMEPPMPPAVQALREQHGIPAGGFIPAGGLDAHGLDGECGCSPSFAAATPLLTPNATFSPSAFCSLLNSPDLHQVRGDGHPVAAAAARPTPLTPTRACVTAWRLLPRGRRH